VRQGDNWCLPFCKIGFAESDVSDTTLSEYAKFVVAVIECYPGKRPDEVRDMLASRGAAIDVWEGRGGGFERSKRLKAAAATDADDEARKDDDPGLILKYERLWKAFEEQKLETSKASMHYTTERERREAAEKRAEEAEARAEEYRAKWEAAEAKLAELSQPLPATGTALVLYAPPKRKRGRPRKQPVAMAAERPAKRIGAGREEPGRSVLCRIVAERTLVICRSLSS
jgi:hypothetical protein